MAPPFARAGKNYSASSRRTSITIGRFDKHVQTQTRGEISTGLLEIEAPPCVSSAPKKQRQHMTLRKRPQLVWHRGNLIDATDVCATGHLSRGLFRCEQCLQVLCPRCVTAHRREHFLLRIDPFFADEKAS